MTIAAAPLRQSPIYNSSDFRYTTQNSAISDNISGVYAKLAGGETFTGEETFAGGIKTDTIQATSTSSKVDIQNTAVSGNVTPLRVLAPNQTGTNTSRLLLGVEDSAYKSGWLQYVPNGFSSSNSYLSMGLTGDDNPMVTVRNWRLGVNTTAPSYNLHVNGSGYFGSDVLINTTRGLYWGSTSGPRIIGVPWDTSASSHSITSSNLGVLSSTDFMGTLTAFAKNGSTSSIYQNFGLIKTNGTIVATTLS